MKVRTEAASEVVDVRRLALSSAGAAGAPPPRGKLVSTRGRLRKGKRQEKRIWSGDVESQFQAE
jgi:hypothetical protein